MSRLPGLLCAAIAGAGVTLSLAPFNIWPFAPIAALLLFAVVRDSTPRQVFAAAFCFSLALFLSGASWVYVSIHEFGYTSATLAAVLTLLFCTGLALANSLAWLLFVLVRPAAGVQPLLAILAFAATGLFTELLRGWLFTGFPWLYLGYSQTGGLLAGWAPVVGVYGVSFILYASGAALGEWLTRSLKNDNKSGQPAHWLAAAAVTLAWAAGPLLHQIEWTERSAKTYTASLVQANISQHEKWRPEMLRPTLDLYQSLSQPEWTHSDVVIWPEAAIPREYHAAQTFIRAMDQRAERTQTALLTGIPWREYSSSPSGDRHSEIYNSIVAVGEGSGVYHKQRLVPFGEYVPLQSILGEVMAFFALPLSGMSSGDATQQALQVGDWQTLPLICYEIVYPSLAAASARASDVLVTVSNDSWFGASLGPKQHLQMAQMRALENGRYLLRGTGNGISAIVDHKGNIVKQSQQFQREVVRGDFRLSQGHTPWSEWGYRALPLVNGLLLFSLALFHYNRRLA